MTFPLDRIDPFDGDNIRVVIEVAAGSRNKLKFNARLAAFELHHVLPEGTAFPRDFGFIPSTVGADGDPLDALVFADESCPPGTLVSCRLIGVIEATQTNPGREPARNDRLLAVAAHSHRYGGWKDIADVPAAVLDQIEAFFESYNAQRGVRFQPLGRRSGAHAAKLLERGHAARSK